jgi:general secretion pathway protein M
MAATRNPTSSLARAQARWQSLPPRERSGVAIATAVVAAAVTWWLLLGPALATLRSAPARHQALDTQLARMGALQAQARAMQALPPANPAEVAGALEASVRASLGETARLVVAGDRATVTFSQVPGATLAQWLAQARLNARALPAEARMQRNAGGTWNGSVVLHLPAR